MKKITLALDTSTRKASMAISAEGALIDSIQGQTSGGHVEECQGNFREILARNELNIEQIERIVFGNGPGSFTGLRIGGAFLQGLQSVLNVPLFSASSLLGYRPEMETEQHHLRIACADAGRGELFAAFYEYDSFRAELLEEVRTVELPELKRVLDGLSGKAKCCWIFDSLQTSELYRKDLESDEYSVSVQSDIAAGLIELFHSNDLSSEKSLFSRLETVDIEYCRPVAARTLRERSVSKP